MSYYTDLDEALGDNEEAREFLDYIDGQRHQRQMREQSRIDAAVAKALKSHGITNQKAKAPAKVRGKKVEVKCKCGEKFMARVADRKRGWGKYCSKSCKAKYMS